jgi:hypothetical protein
MYQFNLGQKFLKNGQAELVEIARSAYADGHPHIIYSSIRVGSGEYALEDVKNWFEFWTKNWPAALASASEVLTASQCILPLLNIVFSTTAPGWDRDEPWLPPAGDEAARNKSLSLLNEIRDAMPDEVVAKGKPFSTTPVSKSQFEAWINGVSDEIFAGREKSSLRDECEQLFETGDSIELGVPLQNLHETATKWFKQAS